MAPLLATIALLVGSALDDLATSRALARGAREVGPVLRFAGHWWRPVKWALTAGLVAMVWIWPALATAGFALGCCFAALGLWNFGVARRMGG